MTGDGKNKQWADGLAIYTDMFGDDRARRRLDSDDPNEARLTDLLLEYAYGSVWSDRRLSRRERSLMTVALLTGLGRNDELETHIGAALNNGCKMSELHEVMIHVGIYCGFPAAISGHKVLKKSEPD
ncbi:MAG: carboxymuconolactone decarboxylase family protein [Alphaproteobacteria bacterium]